LYGQYCTEKVREVIRKAARGEAFIGIASTEAGRGSDVAAIKSTGTREGDCWILNGEKTYTSGAQEAKKLGGDTSRLSELRRLRPEQPIEV
jgi:alkylation response protein AidB-like acyl-CoA dehydrogenase